MKPSIEVAYIRPPLVMHLATLLCLATVPTRAGEIEIIEGPPPGFEIHRLTYDPDMQHSFPDINDKGEVVYGKFIPGTDVWDLYLFTNGRVFRITDDERIEWNPAINNNSEIAWYSLDTLVDQRDLRASFLDHPIVEDALLIGRPEMNDNGDIVWTQRIQEGVSEFDIYLYRRDEGSIERLTDGGNNQEPRINNAGQVVWHFKDMSVSPWIGHILVYSDGVMTDITPGECQCQGPDINEAGDAVWKDAQGVWLSDGTQITLIGFPGSTPRINNPQQIGFAMWSVEEQLWRHAQYEGGVTYWFPSEGLSTARNAINDQGAMAMRRLDLGNGHMELFLLRPTRPKGDGNGDCRIDMSDFGILQTCRTALRGPEGTLLATCVRFDFDDDGDVDLADVSEFLDALTGPPGTVDGCTP